MTVLDIQQIHTKNTRFYKKEPTQQTDPGHSHVMADTQQFISGLWLVFPNKIRRKLFFPRISLSTRITWMIWGRLMHLIRGFILEPATTLSLSCPVPNFKADATAETACKRFFWLHVKAVTFHLLGFFFNFMALEHGAIKIQISLQTWIYAWRRVILLIIDKCETSFFRVLFGHGDEKVWIYSSWCSETSSRCLFLWKIPLDHDTRLEFCYSTIKTIPSQPSKSISNLHTRILDSLHGYRWIQDWTLFMVMDEHKVELFAWSWINKRLVNSILYQQKSLKSLLSSLLEYKLLEGLVSHFYQIFALWSWITP